MKPAKGSETGAGEPTLNQARLEEVVLAWLEACRAGWAPERNRFLAAYPDLRAELLEFVEGQAAVSGAGSELPREAPGGVPLEELGTLGDFRLIREVGRGGMGVVYEAEQITLRRRVALKVLPFAAALDSRQLERFRNEALAAANLRHDHIVPVFAVGMERGVHFYAMQFIEGQSLATLVDTLGDRKAGPGERPDSRSGSGVAPAARGPDATTAPAHHAVSATPVTGVTMKTASATALPENISRSMQSGGKNRHRWVAELGLQAAGGLEHAHQMGVVHRDIKPANLLLDGRGQLWIADFGLARVSQDPGLTRTGEILGTLRYASPEQALGKPGLVDHRSDVYSLGATLYELLTLHPLFGGKDRNALLAQIAQDEPIAPRKLDPTIPLELETIVLKACSKERDDRYGSAREMAEDLGRFLDDRPILARPPSLLERAARFGRRHKGIAVTGLAALGILLVGLSVATVLVGNAYKNERIKADEANDQRVLAEKSFRQAREAVEQLVSISEEQLANIPPLEPVRRRMLEAALTYYEDFLDQVQDSQDPVLEQELEASRTRVRTIVAELTSLAGAAQFRFLANPRVQVELGLDSEQVALVRNTEERFRGMFRKGPGGQPGENERERIAMAREQEAVMRGLLNPGQQKRFEEILLQLRGPTVFAEPDVAEKLGLTTDQRRDIRALMDKTVAGRIFGGGPPNREPRREGGGPADHGPFRGGEFGQGRDGPKGPGGFGPVGEMVQTQLNREAMAILTTEQQAKWAEMTGKPFKLPRGPGGGPPGQGEPRGDRGPGKRDQRP